MDNLVTITNTRENVLEFDVDIQGLNTDDIKVRFVIHADKVCFTFPCNKEEKKWVAIIPQLSYLERTSFPFCIEIIADGYFFEALRGTVNVVGNTEIYATAPKNTAIPPVKPTADGEITVVVPESKKTKTPEPVKPVRGRERSISMIAEELMREQGVKVRSKNAETSKPTSAKDQKIRDILKESKKTETPAPFKKGPIVTH